MTLYLQHPGYSTEDHCQRQNLVRCLGNRVGIFQNKKQTEKYSGQKKPHFATKRLHIQENSYQAMCKM